MHLVVGLDVINDIRADSQKFNVSLIFWGLWCTWVLPKLAAFGPVIQEASAYFGPEISTWPGFKKDSRFSPGCHIWYQSRL